MKTLVLIDNDPLSRALLSQCLTGGGWRVLESDTGETGLNLVHEHRPNAVLCDLRTPKGNGFKVCRRIRETPDLKGTRIVLTSVSRFGNDRDTALAAGADDYLVKPIMPADLLESSGARGRFRAGRAAGSAGGGRPGADSFLGSARIDPHAGAGNGRGRRQHLVRRSAGRRAKSSSSMPGRAFAGSGKRSCAKRTARR